MSKDKTPSSKAPVPAGKAGKKAKGKRVVAVSPPAQPSRLPFLKPAQPAGPRPTASTQPPTARPAARPGAQPEAAVSDWSISLEAALYVLIAVVALGARLFALDRFPLQQGEGESAWAAWNILKGQTGVALASQSPLPVFAAVLSFLLFGDSDVTARLLPALVGGLSVILPFFLRRELGRAAGLIAAALLAVGPTFMYV